MIDDEPAAPIGYRLGGVWSTTAFIGRGPVGEVYACARDGGEETFAAKLLPEELLESSETWSAYLADVTAAGAIQSEATVRHVAFGSDLQLGCPFVVTERVEVSSLAECVSRHGAIAPKRWGAILAIVAGLLERAHATGLSHGRLTPTNVFVSLDEPLKVKVTDFGVGRARAACDADTWSGGVPGWAGPESANGKLTPSPAGDVYSLGLLTFFALTGKPLFRALDSESVDLPLLQREMSSALEAAASVARKLGSELDPVFDKWFQRTIVPSPTARYGSVRLLREAFERVVRRLDVSKPGPAGNEATKSTLTASRLRAVPGAAPAAARAILNTPRPSKPISAVSLAQPGPRHNPSATRVQPPGPTLSLPQRATLSSRPTSGSGAAALAMQTERSSPLPQEPAPAPESEVLSSWRARARTNSEVGLTRHSAAESFARAPAPVVTTQPNAPTPSPAATAAAPAEVVVAAPPSHAISSVDQPSPPVLAPVEAERVAPEPAPEPSEAVEPQAAAPSKLSFLTRPRTAAFVALGLVMLGVSMGAALGAWAASRSSSTLPARAAVAPDAEPAALAVRSPTGAIATGTQAKVAPAAAAVAANAAPQTTAAEPSATPPVANPTAPPPATTAEAPSATPPTDSAAVLEPSAPTSAPTVTTAASAPHDAGVRVVPSPARPRAKRPAGARPSNKPCGTFINPCK